MVVSAFQEDVLNLEDYAEAEEGIPLVAVDKYLVAVTEPKASVAKTGRVNVQYTPVLIESQHGETPDTDRNGTEIRGRKLLPDRLYFVVNPLDKDGMLKTDDVLEKDRAKLIGAFRTAMRGITGESFTQTGTPAQVAAAAADMIAGCRFVATVIQEKPNKRNELISPINRITKHEPEDEWSRDVEDED